MIINIVVVDRVGAIHDLQCPTDMGLSLMELCKACELPVEGTCGGIALCASCHVYIKSPHALSDPTDDELFMLDQTMNVHPNSRLGCQIKLADNLEGLRVQLAPEV